MGHLRPHTHSCARPAQATSAANLEASTPVHAQPRHPQQQARRPAGSGRRMCCALPACAGAWERGPRASLGEGGGDRLSIQAPGAISTQLQCQSPPTSQPSVSTSRLWGLWSLVTAPMTNMTNYALAGLQLHVLLWGPAAACEVGDAAGPTGHPCPAPGRWQNYRLGCMGASDGRKTLLPAFPAHDTMV